MRQRGERPERSQGSVLMGWALPVLLVVGITLNGLRLRQRASELRTLPPAPLDDAPDAATFAALVADTVILDNATAASAAAFGRERSVDLVDLVPADLPAQQALDFVRMVDPVAWRTDPFGSGKGAGHAVVATSDLLRGLPSPLPMGWRRPPSSSRGRGSSSSPYARPTSRWPRR